MVLRRVVRWLRGGESDRAKAESILEPERQQPPEPSWKRFAQPAKPMPTYDDLIEQQARRLVDLVNESLRIAAESSDPETRLGRLDFAEGKLEELLDLTDRNPKISLQCLDQVRADMARLREAYMPTVVFTAEELLRSEGALAEVDGKPIYTLAHMKDDMVVMQACMRAEVENYWRQPQGNRLCAAPFFFERVAVLQRKAKNYEAEIAACEEWLKIVDDYKNQDAVKNGTGAKVWMGARSRKIVDRLPKARELLQRQRAKV